MRAERGWQITPANDSVYDSGGLGRPSMSHPGGSGRLRFAHDLANTLNLHPLA